MAVVQIDERLIDVFGPEIRTLDDLRSATCAFRERNWAGCPPERLAVAQAESRKIFGRRELEAEDTLNERRRARAMIALLVCRHNTIALGYLICDYWARDQVADALRIALVLLETGGRQCSVRAFAAVATRLLGWHDETAGLLEPCGACVNDGRVDPEMRLPIVELRRDALEVLANRTVH